MKKRFESIVAVFLILIRKNNGKEEILLQRRCNTGFMDGMYDAACSGHLEKGEELKEAVIRECKEEIGVTISGSDLKMVNLLHMYENGYIDIFFKTDKFKGNPQIMEPEKCDDLKWFRIDSLPENTSAIVKKALENMKNDDMYGVFKLEK